MRPKYQTRASRAEEQVLSMLKSETSIQKPWSLVSYDLENLALQTTASEAAIIFSHSANLRPGYDEKDNRVYVPNLFVKLSGNDVAFSIYKDGQELRKRDNCFVYDSFETFPAPCFSENSYDAFLKDGLIQKKELLSSDAFKYSFLRREYQEIYVEKVNEILKSRNDFFIGQGLGLTDNEILSTLFQTDEPLIQAFHNFDFQFQPPAVIITNKGKERPTVRQALTLILLSLLGFDIIINSPEGHSDIENILNPDVYCLFYGETQFMRSYRPRNKIRLIAAAAVITIALAGTGFLKQALDSGREAYTIPAQNVNIKDKVITFNDLPLELGIRAILEKETGDISINEISRLGSIRFIGPYSGGPDWYFINGYAPDCYFDVQNTAHYEEGEIKDLSSLSKIPSINHLEVSWQRALNIETLKGSSIFSLSLIHDNITDISALTSVKKMRLLDLSSNDIADLSPLKNMALESIMLQNNNISDIEPLTGIKNLRYLDLCGNPITDISPLNNLTNLEGLYLLDVRIDDFSFLENMKQLQGLNLEKTGLTDASILKDHTRLNFLCLAGNDIEDISSLKNLKLLHHIDISMTNVHDISVLKELPALRTVNMFGITLDDENILNELKNVEFRR